MTTQSNTTHKSVPMLLSAASAEDFERLFHEKGILAAFKEAGFHTVFISNQLPNHSFIDFLGEQADEHYFLKKRMLRKAIIMMRICCRNWIESLPEADASSSLPLPLSQALRGSSYLWFSLQLSGALSP